MSTIIQGFHFLLYCDWPLLWYPKMKGIKSKSYDFVIWMYQRFHLKSGLCFPFLTCQTSTCCTAENNHFLQHKSPFHVVRAGVSFKLHRVCLLSGLRKRLGRWLGWKGGGCSSTAKRGGGGGVPKEYSILIKGPGAEPQLKIETEGDWHRFLQALTARLTAAPQHRAVEPSRESARQTMMRWDGEITSDKHLHPPPISNHPHLHVHTNMHTRREK